MMDDIPSECASELSYTNEDDGVHLTCTLHGYVVSGFFLSLDDFNAAWENHVKDNKGN